MDRFPGGKQLLMTQVTSRSLSPTFGTFASNRHDSEKDIDSKIRWQNLRDTEGWAALQHHAVLRTTVTVIPPSGRHESKGQPPKLRVNLVQGSYFTLLPEQTDSAVVPQWHAGNIYNMERAIPRTVELPHPPSTESPTTYQLFVSGDYEVRT
jgi:hypothetical protein